MSHDFSDFTLDAYAALLDKAVARYQFVLFGDGSNTDGRALWRHDIDFSPHRALVMAELEAVRGVRASYFVQLTSVYYNALEPEISAILRRMADLGHDIGLHFEPAGDAPEERLAFEARTLEGALDTSVRVFSLHNPTTYDAARFEANEVAGLINASAPVWLHDFVYCSDSNGMWRYRALADVVADTATRNIFALTHPEWWQDKAMAPRERIRRCIDGRAEHNMRDYDELLKTNFRPNIGKDCES